MALNTYSVATPTSNTQAQIVLSAPTDVTKRQTLLNITFSYNGTPTSGLLTVVDSVGTTTIYSTYVTASGPGQILLQPLTLQAALTGSLTITLSAGGSGVSGSLSTISTVQ
jgi:hypothetical protein